MIHLIVLRSADEESESEESYEELVTKALGEENCVLVWARCIPRRLQTHWDSDQG